MKTYQRVTGITIQKEYKTTYSHKDRKENEKDRSTRDRGAKGRSRVFKDTAEQARLWQYEPKRSKWRLWKRRKAQGSRKTQSKRRRRECVYKRAAEAQRRFCGKEETLRSVRISRCYATGRSRAKPVATKVKRKRAHGECLGNRSRRRT